MRAGWQEQQGKARRQHASRGPSQQCQQPPWSGAPSGAHKAPGVGHQLVEAVGPAAGAHAGAAKSVDVEGRSGAPPVSVRAVPCAQRGQRRAQRVARQVQAPALAAPVVLGAQAALQQRQHRGPDAVVGCQKARVHLLLCGAGGSGGGCMLAAEGGMLAASMRACHRLPSTEHSSQLPLTQGWLGSSPPPASISARTRSSTALSSSAVSRTADTAVARMCLPAYEEGGGRGGEGSRHELMLRRTARPPAKTGQPAATAAPPAPCCSPPPPAARARPPPPAWRPPRCLGWAAVEGAGVGSESLAAAAAPAPADRQTGCHATAQQLTRPGCGSAGWGAAAAPTPRPARRCVARRPRALGPAAPAPGAGLSGCPATCPARCL